jgi:hypothetical protein
MEVWSAGGCVGMEGQRSGALEPVEAGRQGSLEVMQAWSRRGLEVWRLWRYGGEVWRRWWRDCFAVEKKAKGGGGEVGRRKLGHRSVGPFQGNTASRGRTAPSQSSHLSQVTSSLRRRPGCTRSPSVDFVVFLSILFKVPLLIPL